MSSQRPVSLRPVSPLSSTDRSLGSLPFDEISPTEPEYPEFQPLSATDGLQDQHRDGLQDQQRDGQAGPNQQDDQTQQQLYDPPPSRQEDQSRNSDRGLRQSEDEEGQSQTHINEKRAPVFTRGRFRAGTIVADVLCVAVPLALLIFIAVLVSLNGKEASPSQIDQWREAASVLSTLFPIAFAAVAGRLMVQLARWRLEKGVSVGTLAQLAGSRTLVDAVATQIRLRSLNALAIPLLLLWAFSPLGSQALLRLVQPRLTTTTAAESSRVGYFDTIGSAPSDAFSSEEGGVMGNEWWYAPERLGRLRAELDARNAVYASLLTAPRAAKQSSVDTWGHVRIPLLLGDDKNGSWQPVARNSDRPYASLAGVPLANVTYGNSSFAIESTYVALDCGDMQLWQRPVRKTEDGQPGYLNSTYLAAFGGGGVERTAPNGTFQGFSIDRAGSYDSRQASWSVGVDRFIDERWTEGSGWGAGSKGSRRHTLRLFEDEAGIDMETTRLSFQALVPLSIPEDPAVVVDRYHGTHCTARQRYVESRVECSTTMGGGGHPQCAVVAQRPSQRQGVSANVTALSWPQTWLVLSKYWPLAAAPSSSFAGYANHDLTLQYLVDPDASLAFSDTTGRLGPGKVDKADFSVRLTQALNTYMQLSSAHVHYRGEGISDAPLQTVEASVEQPRTEYAVPTVWAVLGVVSAVLLLASGVASVVVAHLAAAPDVLGYATTALRETSVQLPPGAEAMDGMQLARELRGRRVCYGWLETGGASAEGVVGVGEPPNVSRFH